MNTTPVVNFKPSDYDARTRKFVFFLSDLSRTFGFSAGGTMVLRNPSTDKEATYVVHAVMQSSEGEVEGWQLRPTHASLQRNPAARATSVVVFND